MRLCEQREKAEGLIYVYQRFQGAPRRDPRTSHYVTQHPPAAAKNKFMENIVAFFLEPWRRFVAE
jgi:hypothetical protein